jgi:uncharacterized membrane protein YphA (DoxX/SURF4 family)
MAALVVAVVLLVAGVSKLARPAEWRSQARGLGVPGLVSAVVPFVEVLLGALLLVQVQRHVVAWLAVGLFGAFTALLALRLAQGQHPPCACFGSLSSKPIGLSHVARNVALICLGVAAALL